MTAILLRRVGAVLCAAPFTVRVRSCMHWYISQQYLVLQRALPIRGRARRTATMHGSQDHSAESRAASFKWAVCGCYTEYRSQ